LSLETVEEVDVKVTGIATASLREAVVEDAEKPTHPAVQ